VLTYLPKVICLSAIKNDNQDSEEKYRQLFEKATEAIIMFDEESSHILDCNQAAAELVERAKDELVGQHESILYPPESAHIFTKTFKDAQSATQNRIKLDTKVITKSGKIKDVSINGNSIKSVGKNVIFGSFRDITKQKQVEAVLRYSEEQFGILAETWPNMIVIVQDGKVVYLNQETVRVTGYSREEFFAPDFDYSKLISPEFLPNFTVKFEKLLKGLDLEPFEFTLISKSGALVDAIWSIRPITFNGKVSLVGVATDISERKKTEKQIITQKNQLEGIFASSPDAITVTDMRGTFWSATMQQPPFLG
jgi:PAS domain S-box-containing protein